MARTVRCPVATTLDIVGDRWTLLVIRDLLRGQARFGELESSVEGIPPSVLSDRLKILEREGIVSRRFFLPAPPRGGKLPTRQGAAPGGVGGAGAGLGGAGAPPRGRADPHGERRPAPVPGAGRAAVPFEMTLSHRGPLPRDDIRRYAEVGVDRVVSLPWRRGREAEESMQRLADEVL